MDAIHLRKVYAATLLDQMYRITVLRLHVLHT